MPWKPAGYTSVAPYVLAAGAQQVIDFAARVFGAEVLRRYDRPDGTIMHAELRIDDTVVMLAEATADWPTVPTMLHVYVEDVDESFRRALAAGATAIQEPTQGDDPDRRCGVRDPAGNSWWLATQIDS